MGFDHLVVPRSFLRGGYSLKRRAQLTFSSNDKVKALGKLDATNLAIVIILSFALVVSRYTTMLMSLTVLVTMFNSPCSCSSDLRTNNTKT